MVVEDLHVGSLGYLPQVSVRFGCFLHNLGYLCEVVQAHTTRGVRSCKAEKGKCPHALLLKYLLDAPDRFQGRPFQFPPVALERHPRLLPQLEFGHVY